MEITTSEPRAVVGSGSGNLEVQEQDRTLTCVVARKHLTDCSTEANDTNSARRETYAARFELKGDNTRNNVLV